MSLTPQGLVWTGFFSQNDTAKMLCTCISRSSNPNSLLLFSSSFFSFSLFTLVASSRTTVSFHNCLSLLSIETTLLYTPELNNIVEINPTDTTSTSKSKHPYQFTYTIHIHKNLLLLSNAREKVSSHRISSPSYPNPSALFFLQKSP